MMEPIQGEGGVMPLDKEFVQSVTKYAHGTRSTGTHR